MTIENDYSELELQFKQTVKAYRPQLDSLKDEIEFFQKEANEKIKELQNSYAVKIANLEDKAAALSEECGLSFYYIEDSNPLENVSKIEYTPKTFKKWDYIPCSLFDFLKEYYPNPKNVGWDYSTMC